MLILLQIQIPKHSRPHTNYKQILNETFWSKIYYTTKQQQQNVYGENTKPKINKQ